MQSERREAKDPVLNETTNIHEYIKKMSKNDPMHSEYLRQQKLKKEEEEPWWKDRALHGMYHQQMEAVVDIQKS